MDLVHRRPVGIHRSGDIPLLVIGKRSGGDRHHRATGDSASEVPFILLWALGSSESSFGLTGSVLFRTGAPSRSYNPGYFPVELAAPANIGTPHRHAEIALCFAASPAGRKQRYIARRSECSPRRGQQTSYLCEMATLAHPRSLHIATPS